MAVPTGLNAEQRTLRAKLAQAERAAQGKYSAETGAKGQAGLLTKFEREVDPDGSLDPLERRRRAEAKRKAHMLRLSFLSAKARRNRTVGP